MTVYERYNSNSRACVAKLARELRMDAPPSDCKVFDLHGNLLRIEQPTPYITLEFNGGSHTSKAGNVKHL